MNRYDGMLKLSKHRSNDYEILEQKVGSRAAGILQVYDLGFRNIIVSLTNNRIYSKSLHFTRLELVLILHYDIGYSCISAGKQSQKLETGPTIKFQNAHSP